jgi:hypothetical protein
MATYNLPIIAGALLAAYVVSLLLSRQGKYLSIALHRKIWNALLVAAFAGMAGFALLTLILFDYNIRLFPREIDVNFLHTEFGIAFILIGAFHALWHLPYFAQYLPKAKAPAQKPVVPSVPVQAQLPVEKKE